MEEMQSEAEILACTNPRSLPEDSRFLLEMDGDRYVRGNCNFHDKSYWLSAMRAAVSAGRRIGRRVRVVRRSKKAGHKMDINRNKMMRATREKVTAKIKEDFANMEKFPFETFGKETNKRVVSSDGTQMAIMRSNKRYRPGD